VRYSYPQVVFQEVPDEITLALSISGCDLKCPGCHSPETWDSEFGEILTFNVIDTLLERHRHISCVLFYGGEWDSELIEFIKYIKSKNIKTALYTGQELDYFDDEFINQLDYIKTGRYIQSLGPLKTPKTNQRFYKLR